MTPRWEELGGARKRVRASDLLQNLEPWVPPELAGENTERIDLPPETDDAELYFTEDGRLISLPPRRLVPTLYTHVLKGLTVLGFVVVAAACGAVLA